MDFKNDHTIGNRLGNDDVLVLSLSFDAAEGVKDIPLSDAQSKQDPHVALQVWNMPGIRQLFSISPFLIFLHLVYTFSLFS